MRGSTFSAARPHPSYHCAMPGDELLSRITQTPAVSGGRPRNRGMRIRVVNVLEVLGAETTEAEILSDFSDPEKDDIRTSLVFSASRTALVLMAA